MEVIILYVILAISFIMNGIFLVAFVYLSSEDAVKKELDNRSTFDKKYNIYTVHLNKNKKNTKH